MGKKLIKVRGVDSVVVVSNIRSILRRGIDRLMNDDSIMGEPNQNGYDTAMKQSRRNQNGLMWRNP